MEFALNKVLKTMQRFEEQIVGSTQRLGTAFKTVQGYSGTLPNHFVFPHEIVADKDRILSDEESLAEIRLQLESSRRRS